MADGRTMVTLKQDELLTLVRRCIEYRNADVFAFGCRDSISRLGEIAGYIFMLHDAEGKPRADAISIVLPPQGDREPGVMREEVRAGVHRAYRRMEDDDRTIPFAEKAYASVRIGQMQDFTGDALVAQLAKAQDREAMIVGEASLYRFQDVTRSREEPALAEDVWCAHLHKLMLAAEGAARATGSYVILDIGEYLPASEANVEFLKTTGDVGLSGHSIETKMTSEEILEQVDVLYNVSAQGDIGKALATIDAETRMSDRQKWMLRLVMLGRAGMRDQVSAMLDASADVIAALDADMAVGVARIAAEEDRDDMAQILLGRALPTLMSERDLENTLRVAQETRRLPLVEKVRNKLRRLHPGSDVLRVEDAQTAGRDGNYARAAALLAYDPDAVLKEQGKMFAMLAEAVDGKGFADSVALSRDLCRRMPARTASIQNELIRSLERAGRRDEAIGFLLSGDIAWNERWLVIARELIERAVASGSKAVPEEVLAQLLEIAIKHLASHPADGLARTSIADLFDPTRIGARGLALLALAALARSEIRHVVGEGTEKEPARLDDIGRMPGIMERVLTWLRKQGDGIIISGRHVVPTEVLGEDPDAVLHALLRMADHYVPDATNETDTLIMRNLSVIAVAVAPNAADPDQDLAVLRGAAIKLILGGRPQVARDLAEHALLVAGDRPARRRKALAAFADIYARVGRLRESLLTLAAALEIPVDQDLFETWHEQVLLVRLARDVGLVDHSLRIISSLRGAVAKAGGLEKFGHRMDTLELQAQDLMRRADDGDAWPLEKLLDAATVNAAAVLAAGDEVLPITFMLRQLVDEADSARVEVPAATRQKLDDLVDLLAPPHKTLITAVARLPNLASVAAVAGPIQAARYNDDASYDMRLARTMGRRLARAATGTNDPTAFAYSIEALAVHGVGVRNAAGEVAAAPRILVEEKAALAAAVDIAGRGISVVGMALDNEGLMVMTVSGEGAAVPIAVPKTTFDPLRLAAWRERFPYCYMDKNLTEANFRTSVEGLGLPQLPERALVVSGDMTLVPPNVLQVDGGLAGESRVLATTPSLGWLQASLANGRTGDGTAAAWIPVAADTADTDVLTLLRNDVEDVLVGANVTLHTQVRPPVVLASADLAIIGGHGGLAEPNRFFRSLSDDKHQPADLRQVGDALRRSRMAVLFVCSGGRHDRHPESGGLVGISHRLLDLGLEAVVAPSWPIPFNVARPWLLAFLEAWSGRAQAVDACDAENRAVAKATSYDLRRFLAMTLHGNPFITSQ